MKIYGVQAFENDDSTKFFDELVTLGFGQHLKLSEFSNICDIIMAICYREKGAEYLEVRTCTCNSYMYPVARYGYISGYTDWWNVPGDCINEMTFENVMRVVSLVQLIYPRIHFNRSCLLLFRFLLL